MIFLNEDLFFKDGSQFMAFQPISHYYYYFTKKNHLIPKKKFTFSIYVMYFN